MPSKGSKQEQTFMSSNPLVAAPYGGARSSHSSSSSGGSLTDGSSSRHRHHHSGSGHGSGGSGGSGHHHSGDRHHRHGHGERHHHSHSKDDSSRSDRKKEKPMEKTKESAMVMAAAGAPMKDIMNGAPPMMMALPPVMEKPAKAVEYKRPEVNAGIWSRNTGIGCAFLLVMQGILLIINGTQNGTKFQGTFFSNQSLPNGTHVQLSVFDPTGREADHNGFELILGASATIFGAILGWLEYRVDPLPNLVRFVMYLVSGIVCFFHYTLVPAGLCLIINWLIIWWSMLLGEKPAMRMKDQDKKEKDEVNVDFPTAVYNWYLKKRATNTFGSVFLILVFLAVNVYLFSRAYRYWSTLVAAIDAGGVFYASYWLIIAKSFGYILNFDCAFLAVPVLRSIVRIMNISFANKSLAFYAPVGHNIEFHRFCAWFMLFAAFGHMVGHYLNVERSWGSLRFAGVLVYGFDGAWSSGLLVVCIMIPMFGAAQDSVKRRNFETFWFVHHFFILFWAALIAHGPWFYKWALVPIGLYFIERMTRPSSIGERVAENILGKKLQKVYLHEVRYFEPGVLMLKFQNYVLPNGRRQLFDYKEGQFVKIACPAVSRLEYHPFTISSAPEDPFLTLHIKVNQPGTWTHKLKEYLIALNGTNEKDFQLMGRDENGLPVPGLALNPEGEHIMRVEGPYAAPCQHISEYQSVILVGAGIGLTPFSSTLRSIILRKWGKHQEQCTTTDCHCFVKKLLFIWSAKVDDLFAYAWFVDQLILLRDVYVDYRINKLSTGAAFEQSSNDTIEFECKIFLTGTVSDEQLAVVKKRLQSARDLEDPARQRFADTIQVAKGRPPYGDMFGKIRNKYEYKKVGVFGCGPMTVELQKNCIKYSGGHTVTEEQGGPKRDTVFQLHAEVF